MKKVLIICIVCLSVIMTSCQKEKEEYVDYTPLYGKWYEIVDEAEEEYITSTITTYWTFRSDKTATQEVELVMNGIVIIDEKLNYNYVYDGTYIEFSQSDGTYFRYSVNVSGNKMTLGNSEDGYFYLTKK